MLGRFHISDGSGDLAGAQCGNGGNGDGDDADVQGVVPMECDNDLLPEREDRNGRHWSRGQCKGCAPSWVRYR